MPRSPQVLGLGAAFVVLGSYGVGCAAQVVSVDALLAEGQRNMIKAHNAHSGEVITAKGRVEYVGLREQRSRIEGTETSVVVWEARRVKESFGLVVLAPEESARGRLFCSFEPEDLNQLENISKGALVKVIGNFCDYRRAQAGLAIDLSHCEIVN